MPFPDASAGGYERLAVNEFFQAAVVVDPYLVSLIPDAFDPTLARVYPWLIGQDVQYPAAIFLPLGDLPDAQSEGGYRVISNCDYAVSVIQSGLNLTQLQADAYSRIDQILQNAGASLPHGRIVSCVRMSPWGPPVAQDAGMTYNRVGGRYRFNIQSVPPGVPDYVVVGGSSYQLHTERFVGPRSTVTTSIPIRLLLNVTRNGQAVYPPEGYSQVSQVFTPNPALMDSTDEFVVQFYG